MDGINFANHLANFIGETVTVFTASGGESGSGFTGVVLSVNANFLRLVTEIGTAPGCALGNCCTGFPRESIGNIVGETVDELGGEENQGRASCGIRRVGSVTDIPIDRIVAFVHNAV